MKVRKNFEGNDVYCICCGRYFKKFARTNFSAKYYNLDFFKDNQDTRCPYCKSWPRHRIVCDYLEKNPLPQNASILVFAIPYAYRVWFKRNKLKLISADLFDRTADRKVDILNTPFSDNEFDFISCDHVLEHVPDYHAALRELFRITKQGGIVALTVPLLEKLEQTHEDETITTIPDRVRVFGQHDHVRVFGMDFYTAITDVGFDLSIHDGDKCDKKLAPLTAPANYDYNKVFISKKP